MGAKIEGAGTKIIKITGVKTLKNISYTVMPDRIEAGTEGQSKRIEAIQIELENLEDYTIEYKVHIQDIGWTNWYRDGEMAGTVGKGLRIEGIKIRIVSKYKKHYIGIDVSHWQGDINYEKLVASQKIDFMITRG